MLITDIKRVIEQVSREKGINKDVLISTLKEAIESAARKKLGARADIEVHYDEKSGEVEVFQFKEVVSVVEDPEVELTIEDGLKYDPECEEGDSLGIKVDTSLFGRIAAQSAKQVIIQKMKEAERNAVYDNYINKKGEIINGIVQRIDRGNLIVNLGQAEAVLPSKEQMPKENYKRGDRIRAYVLDVLEESRSSQIVLSRTHPEFLVKLFAAEVPEVAESIVTIQSASREPGVRSKVAVTSSDSDVDPVGACVGIKGNRVQSIVQELKGEKIDIIQWNPDIAKFVCNALAPAEISKVVIDEENRTMEIIVPDEFLSIAIGKNGQNVRLASKLTGWHLDVMSKDEYSRKEKQKHDALMKIPGMTDALADALYKNGFSNPKDVASADIANLISTSELSEQDAILLKQRAGEARYSSKYFSDKTALHKNEDGHTEHLEREEDNNQAEDNQYEASADTYSDNTDNSFEDAEDAATERFLQDSSETE